MYKRQGLNILEHLAAVVHKDLGLAVLTLRGAADMTARQVHHQLAAVADSQHRDAPVEDLGVDSGRIFQICLLYTSSCRASSSLPMSMRSGAFPGSIFNAFMA